jgi:hypothetical protein
LQRLLFVRRSASIVTLFVCRGGIVLLGYVPRFTGASDSLLREKQSMAVRIMTFITNAGGSGPGHSAVAVDSTAYTFEDIGGGWFQNGSGWRKLDVDTYLKNNEHRPVLLQTLKTVTPEWVVEYVNYALPQNIIFEPKGFDTPYGVFYCARRLKLVTGEQYVWPGRAKLTVNTWASIVNKLKGDYPDVLAKMDVSR